MKLLPTSLIVLANMPSSYAYKNGWNSRCGEDEQYFCCRLHDKGLSLAEEYCTYYNCDRGVCHSSSSNGWSEWGNGGKPSHKPTKRPTTQSSWGSSSWWGGGDVNHVWVWNGWSSNEWETTSSSWKPASPTPAPSTNSQVGDDHFELEGNFQVSHTASLGTPVPGWSFCDESPDVLSLEQGKVTASGVLTLQVGGKITIAENKCHKTVYVLVPVDNRADPACESRNSLVNNNEVNAPGDCKTIPTNCFSFSGHGTFNVQPTETGQSYLRVANDLNVGTIECDTLVIEQWDTGSTSGTKKGYYYDDKPFDTYHKSW